MTENEIIRLLQGTIRSEKSIDEQREAFSAHDKEQVKELLDHRIEHGIIAEDDDGYFILKEQKRVLAKVTRKNRNFVILKSIPDNKEYRLSGKEADQLLLGDLVYLQEFQKGVFHAVDYLESTDHLKGSYAVTSDGQGQIHVDYLNNCGKVVLVTEFENNIDKAVQPGDLLNCRITEIKGNIIKTTAESILVRSDDVGSDISRIIADHDAPLSFPAKVTEEAKSVEQEISPEEKEGRIDFTKDCVVTIDGDDSHDFDDAVSGKRVLNGYEITVHIADVTHYRKKNHPLDEEAFERGTSIYVADRVVPRLPFELSTGICSLNPNEERLVLSVTRRVDANGNVFSSKVNRGVIKSHGRLTYNKVNAFFKGEDVGFSKEIGETLNILHEAALKIRKRRRLNGARELESTELKFTLDENGNPIDVKKHESGESEQRIEDLRIIANVAVAKLLKEKGVPVLYRIHEFPPKDKLSNLRQFLKRQKLYTDFPKSDEDVSGKSLNDYLNSIKEPGRKKAANYRVLRSRAKARYSPEDKGHFGLAESTYCHFTSPIRRYPDDIIHREIKDYILDGKPFDKEELTNRLRNEGDFLSDCEVRADRIERECDDLEGAKYRRNHIGETYHGIVSGMVNRGRFIERDNGIEGFLPYHCRNGDFFRYRPDSYGVFGRDTDISFTLGTPIDVTVLYSDPDRVDIGLATPVFYDKFCKDRDIYQRKDVALNGLHLVHDDEEGRFTRPGEFFFDDFAQDEQKENDNMNENEEKIENQSAEDENLSDALDQLDGTNEKIQRANAAHAEEDDDFRPTPEQWKEVDVIRAVEAKYPDDEAKVISVLAVMDIDEDEYKLLKRFAAPRQRREGRGGGRSGFGGHSGHGFSHGGRGEGRSFGHDRHSDRGGFGSGRPNRGRFSDEGRKERRGGDSGYASKTRHASFSGYAGASDRGFSRGGKDSGRGGYSSRGGKSFRGDRKGGFGHDKPTPNYGKKGFARAGYGKKRRGE